MIWEVLSVDRLAAMTPDEAAALLAVRRAGGAGGQDTDVLAAWLDLGERHREAWRRAGRAWDVFDEAEGDELLDAMRKAALAAKPEQARAWPRMAAAAAAALLVLAGGVSVVMLRDGAGAPGPVVAEIGKDRPAPQVLQSQPGQRRDVVLADGSKVTLDAGSRVEVAFAERRRELRLTQGRAFFDVAHDRERPFVVRARDQEVTAVGTRFDVRLDPGRIRVVLLQGQVKVGRENAPATLLQPGQQLEVQPGGTPVVSASDLEATLGWREGVLVFNDTPLADAVVELNRGNVDQVIVRDPRIAALRISGRFQAGDVARFGRVLAQVHPVRMVETAPHRLEIVAAR